MVSIKEITDEVKTQEKEVLFVVEHRHKRYYEIEHPASDGEGFWVRKAYVETDTPNVFEEIDLESLKDELANKLVSHVNTRLLIKDALSQEPAINLVKLKHVLEPKAKAKIRPSIQKGSCYYLNIKGRNGKSQIRLSS